MKKTDLSEDDIRAIFITPAILKSGWDNKTQIRRQAYFTDGKLSVKGTKKPSGGKGNMQIIYYIIKKAFQ